VIELRELQWGRDGDAARRLTAAVSRGTCALIAAPEPVARGAFDVIGGRTAAGSGRILLDARDLTHDPLERRRLAFCTHDLPLLPVTAIEYLELAAAGRDGQAAPAASTLRMAGLSPDARVPALEHAARQTLDLAAAVASGAPILLVHAPFSGGTVDDHARRRALLAEARHEGRTVLVSGISHRDALVDAVIEAGR